MLGMRFDRIRTGTAIALVLSFAYAGTAIAQEPDVSALVPVPEAANVPPPSAADVATPKTTASVPTAPASSTVVVLPDPPNLPPPTFKDVTPPAAAPTTTATPAPAAAPATAPTTTATPTPAPAPAPSAVATADQPTADALRDLITTKLARMTDRKADRAAIEAFYAGRNYAPAWIANGELNKTGKAVSARLSAAGDDGLDAIDYPVPSVKAGAEPAALADAELRLTLSALTYARHAQIGRVHYSRVSSDILYTLTPPDPAQVLSNLSTASNADAALQSYNPPHAAYKALRAKLVEARGNKDTGPARIAGGPVLQLGKDKKGGTILMQDERVPMLRDRLGLAPVKGDTFYDKPLADAVAAFQKEKGIKANGDLTPATVDALNGKRNTAKDADIIVANMERWRWVNRDLGKAHVVLNIPDYTLQVYKDGASIWKTRVVVGLPSKATPLLTETMKYITVNPTWNVPPSIIYNEYLPALKQDPTVLDRMGLKLTQNRDGSVHISQPPGEANALGRIRFNFPNKFLVYQHDTPDKHLFSKEARAYSHGCMRVENPAKYAEVMTGLGIPGSTYTEAQIKGMYGRSEIDLKFTNPIPVHITYQTAFVDEHGKLVIRNDIYGRDQRLLVALKAEDKRMAEVPVEHAQPNYSRPSVQLPSRFSSDGPSFFDRLFGNPVQPEPARTQRRQTRVETTAPAPVRRNWMDRTN